MKILDSRFLLELGYFWNKLWVFSAKVENAAAHINPQEATHSFFADFPKYLLISIGGLLINTVILTFMTTFIHPLFAITPAAWLNIAKIVAIAAALIWNFLGYKFVVFRDRA